MLNTLKGLFLISDVNEQNRHNLSQINTRHSLNDLSFLPGYWRYIIYDKSKPLVQNSVTSAS